jgi:hypothetical protein
LVEMLSRGREGSIGPGVRPKKKTTLRFLVAIFCDISDVPFSVLELSRSPGVTAAVLIVNAFQEILLIASWSQVNRSLSMTLRYPTSLRMQAVMATLNGFPAAVSRW